MTDWSVKESVNKYHRERRKKLKDAGLCCICGKKQAPWSSSMCEEHLRRHSERQKGYDRKNAEAV